MFAIDVHEWGLANLIERQRAQRETYLDPVSCDDQPSKDAGIMVARDTDESRIAALADLHYSPQSYDKIREQMSHIRDEAELLVLAGDLTNFGRPQEMESLLTMLVRLRIPIVAVLGNHDYESGEHNKLMEMMSAEGVKILDGTAYERDGIGFAGTKGFLGGFGRSMLTAFGEPEVKAFVQAGIDEALKLERALSQLRTEKRVIVIHYSPIGDTVEGEPKEIYPYFRKLSTDGSMRSPRRKCRLSRARTPRQSRWKNNRGDSRPQRSDADQRLKKS